MSQKTQVLGRRDNEEPRTGGCWDAGALLQAALHALSGGRCPPGGSAMPHQLRARCDVPTGAVGAQKDEGVAVRTRRRPGRLSWYNDREQPTLAEQAHNRDHKSTDPCGRTKKQHNSSLRRKGILAPLRIGGANIAPDVTDGVFPCEVGAAP